MSPNLAGRRLYATFGVAGHYLGIDVLHVQEVLREQRLTPVPLASPIVAGLINLRGQIVPALEMRQLLRLPPRAEGAETFSIVVRTAHGEVSLQVDEIADVLELEASRFATPPPHLDPSLQPLLLGVHEMQDRLLLVLDLFKATAVDAAGERNFQQGSKAEEIGR
jgi:purine-binding chemotaxis protein CheW